MNLLAISTSTTRASIALNRGETVFELEEDTLSKHAEWLLVAIEQLLNQAQLKLIELDGIVFDEGPGSFTGLRIACSMAKGLALGSDLPLYPVSSLVAIAIGAEPRTYLLSVIDARMNAWYWAPFESGKQLQPALVSAPAEIQWDEVSPIAVAGVGFEALQDTLPKDLLRRIEGYQSVYPKARYLLKWVEQSPQMASVSPSEARPLYIRNKVV